MLTRCSWGHTCSCGHAHSRTLALPFPCPATEHTRPSGGGRAGCPAPCSGWTEAAPSTHPLDRVPCRPVSWASPGPLALRQQTKERRRGRGCRQDPGGRGAGVGRALGVGEAGEGSVAGGACPSTWATQHGRDRSSLRPHQLFHRFSTAKAPPRAAVGELQGRDAPALVQGVRVTGVRGAQGCPSPTRLAVLLDVHTQMPGLARAP